MESERDWGSGEEVREETDNKICNTSVNEMLKVKQVACLIFPCQASFSNAKFAY